MTISMDVIGDKPAILPHHDLIITYCVSRSTPRIQPPDQKAGPLKDRLRPAIDVSYDFGFLTLRCLIPILSAPLFHHPAPPSAIPLYPTHW